MPSLTLRVGGRPRPQGSVKARPNGTVEYSQALVRWRRTVTETVVRSLGGVGVFETLSVPVVAVADFVLAGDPSKPPDLDKLQRAVGDALKDAGVLADDALIVGWYATKRAPLPGEIEGVRITLEW